MNCEQFEQLIALQVEGDLPDNQQSKVSKHLLICGSCHRFAEEIRDSQLSLRSYTGEDFDESLLAGIRHNVMAQIHSGEIALSRWERIAEWFGLRDYHRLLWATGGAAAVLLLAGSLATYYIHSTNRSIEIGADIPQFNLPGPADVPKPLLKSEIHQVSNERPQHAKSVENRLVEQPAVTVVNFPVETVPNTSLPVIDVNTNATASAQGVVDDEKADDSELPVAVTPKNMTRIEMRTARQNIRIIWFAEKKTSAPPAAALSDSE
jgi:hypothetical protein